MPKKTKRSVQDLLSTIQKNSNVQYLAELKTIAPGATGKDLTEKQKLAFQAMMRIALDPEEKSWTKRKEKLDRQRAARIEAETEYRRLAEIKKQYDERKALPKRESLKLKVMKMRAKRIFPTKRERREDPARRYGFIPRSQKKTDLFDYGKV
ncbi:AAEL013681-PA [Aedes aegypti]|uniref:AAEL013681-PA n=1 Tax=Aedes aegypti TaxID=7159 RepID=Q16IG5_AEDAE|nr:AAEL013681-PA [Aedes aegypti]